MKETEDIFQRTELLLGEAAMERLAGVRVILFGVGGVGSWCAESLVRSGVTHLTLVDGDRVCASNLNRQLLATADTLGQVKVNALRERLLRINPNAQIRAEYALYTAETAEQFALDSYDYVVDAIDSLQHKAHLMVEATRLGVKLFSSMGAALKLDPTRIRVAEFWQVQGCPLAASLRRRFRKSKVFPARKFLCVYSDELLTNHYPSLPASADTVRVNGTVAHITAIFGFTLAGLLVQDVVKTQ